MGLRGGDGGGSPATTNHAGCRHDDDDGGRNRIELTDGRTGRGRRRRLAAGVASTDISKAAVVVVVGRNECTRCRLLRGPPPAAAGAAGFIDRGTSSTGRSIRRAKRGRRATTLSRADGRCCREREREVTRPLPTHPTHAVT